MGAESPIDERPGLTSPARSDRVVLADGRRVAEQGLGPRRRVWWWIGVPTVLALVVILAAGLALSSRAAEREGVAQVRRTTEVLAGSVIQPGLTPGLLAGQPAAIEAMDRLVSRSALPADVVRVKLWAADGRIVYSDASPLLGTRYRLNDDELLLFRTGGTHAEVTDLSLPENRLERPLGDRLLEVYSRVRAPDGTPLLFEAYYSYADVEARRTALLRSFASITLVGLFVFAAFQVSLGYTTVRWLHRERDRLLDSVVNLSEGHRRRLASDLHDGVVQDLVGASFVVAGAAADLRRQGDGEMAAELNGPVQGIRASIQRLRSMIVDLYPAALRTAGLESALSDLAAPLRLHGIDVRIETPGELHLPEHAQILIYRLVQEAFANVVDHSAAGQVRLGIRRGASGTVVEITDDGTGFDPGDASAPGQTGLAAMADLAREARALLEVSSQPGHGTTLRMELPT